MKLALLDRLRCPVCRNTLALQAIEGDGQDGPNGVVNEGLLLCDACKVWYPLTNDLPVMLVFPTPLHDRFAARHADRLSKLTGYHPVDGAPEEGERSIQETFTAEWDTVQDDELTFLYKADDLVKLHRDVWLRWMRRDRVSVKSLLNVGCGLGRESMALREAVPDAEVVAIDSNFAVLRSGPKYRSIDRFHLVISSLFHPPFAPGTFDLVYSQGVIHHTFSTVEAFRSIVRFVKPGGHMFIWVYGLEDHLVLPGFLGMMTRLYNGVEAVIRPLLSRAPSPIRNVCLKVLTVVLHPVLKSRVRNKKEWKLQNTEMNLRDWLTPRYARRHGFNEVIEWYEDAGFDVIDVQSSRTYRALFGKRMFGVGMTGRSTAAAEAGEASAARREEAVAIGVG